MVPTFCLAPPKGVWIAWTAGLVEPGDRWMMVTIHLSAAPNPRVGPPRALRKCKMETIKLSIRLLKGRSLKIPHSVSIRALNSLIMRDFGP